MQCYVHGNTEAIGTCVHCGKFICENCNTEVANKNYCKTCINDVLNEKDRQINKNESNGKESQPIIINNSASSSASASASVNGMRMPYPKQSFWIHLACLIFTAGLGNVIYFFVIKSRQKRWLRMYG